MRTCLRRLFMLTLTCEHGTRQAERLMKMHGFKNNVDQIHLNFAVNPFK